MMKAWTPEERMETVAAIVRRVIEDMPRGPARLDLLTALYILGVDADTLNDKKRGIDHAFAGQQEGAPHG